MPQGAPMPWWDMASVWSADQGSSIGWGRATAFASFGLGQGACCRTSPSCTVLAPVTGSASKTGAVDVLIGLDVHGQDVRIERHAHVHGAEAVGRSVRSGG